MSRMSRTISAPAALAVAWTCVSVGDDEVGALGLAEADFIGLDHEFVGFAAVVDGAEHDHAVAEGELGVLDGFVVGGEVDGLLFKAEGGDEPVDGGEGVAVTEAGDDGGGAGFGLVAHDGKSATSGKVMSSEKRRCGFFVEGGTAPLLPGCKVPVFIGFCYDSNNPKIAAKTGQTTQGHWDVSS